MLRKLLLLCIFLFTAQTAQASYAVVNADNGGLLLGDRAHEQLPIASLTKIWTAYIVLKNSSLDEQVSISHEAAHMEGSSIYLQQGQTKTVEYLLYGLLLRSGNDAATALAEHVGGSVDGFVKLMNDEAERIGLKRTHFKNPSGLHDDEHLISAYDLAYMLNISMKNPHFRQIASSTYYTDGETHWSNKHRLVGKGAALAGKTGFTKVAGRTLATYYHYKDRAFSVVTLNAANDWNVHGELANKIEQEFSPQRAVKRGRYTIAGETIVVSRPIEVLAQNGKNMEHFIRFSRLREKTAYWHIVQDDQTLAIERVEIE